MKVTGQIQYKGVPCGSTDKANYWFSSKDSKRDDIGELFFGDLPLPERMAFDDADASKVLYILHHEDDEYQDDHLPRSKALDRENWKVIVTRLSNG